MLNKESLLKLNNFWPQRPAVSGFSIEKLAKRCREKIYKNKNNIDIKSQENNFNNIDFLGSNVTLSNSSTHWANRDFFEYK